MLRQSRASLSARSWAFCSHAERPSIGPELRSERRLCERLTSIWLTAGLVDWGLEDPVPDYSTFPRTATARSRERSVRRLFEGVAVRCERPGLVSGEGFVIASVIEADASRGRKVDGKAHDVAGSGKEHARSRLRRQWLITNGRCGSSAEEPMVCRLTAGGSRIRTLSPSVRVSTVLAPCTRGDPRTSHANSGSRVAAVQLDLFLAADRSGRKRRAA